MFCFKSLARNSYGRAEIGIHLGHKKARETILKAGSRLSEEVNSAFLNAKYVIAKRKQYEDEGKVRNHVLQVDIPFKSQSGAGEFLNGRSFDGNSNWKTEEGNIPLKELLE